MGEQPPMPEKGSGPEPSASERLTEEVKQFFDFILEDKLDNEEVFDDYCIIEGNVKKIKENVDKYIKMRPGTKVKVINEEIDKVATADFLVGCDPNNQLFFVVDMKDNK